MVEIRRAGRTDVPAPWSPPTGRGRWGTTTTGERPCRTRAEALVGGLPARPEGCPDLLPGCPVHVSSKFHVVPCQTIGGGGQTGGQDGEKQMRRSRLDRRDAAALAA
jgi:hypothetical protein